MKKNKKWFIDKWTKERDKTDIHDPMYHFINEFIADVNQLDEPEELSMELPAIPKYVADYLEFAKKESSLIQVMETTSVIDGWITMKRVFDWILANDETFALAWLDGYRLAEEPLYYALVKGHELVDIDGVYWIYDKNNDDVFISGLHPLDDNFLKAMSKSEWIKLSINDSNANFVKVEEVEK